jgi:GDP-L-fucose synthase
VAVPEVPFDLAGKRIWVAGHRGMVGSAVVRRLAREGAGEILTAGRDDADLRRQTDVEAWMKNARPDVVVLAAAKVGGILANDSFPAEFLYDNLMIEANIIHTAAQVGVEKLLFLGSSCIYPKLAPQPITEDALLTGPLEPTNEWYAIAKIAGIKLCQAYRKQYGHDFISAMPTNLYGPGDNYDLQTSHVIPALLRKAHEAKHAGAATMTVWGSGTPRREFMHVDDLADALVFLLKGYSGDAHVNVGSGTDVTIADLARLVCDAAGFRGTLVFDASKPDGTPRKLMDGSKLQAMGWQAGISLEQGLAATYDYFTHGAAADTWQTGLAPA